MIILKKYSIIILFLLLAVSNHSFSQVDSTGMELTPFQFSLFQDIVNDEFLISVKNEKIKTLLETLDSTTIAFIVGKYGTRLRVFEVEEFLNRLKFQEFGDFNDFSIYKNSHKELTLQYTKNSYDESQNEHKNENSKIKFPENKYRTPIDSNKVKNHPKFQEMPILETLDYYNIENDSIKSNEVSLYEPQNEYKNPKTHNLRDYVLVSLSALGSLTSIYLAIKEHHASNQIVDDVFHLPLDSFRECYPEYESKNEGLQDAYSKIDKALIYFAVGGVVTVTTTVSFYVKSNPKSSGDLSFKINPTGASLVYKF